MVTPTLRAGWRTSSYTGNGEECFDVDFTNLGVELRHSIHREPVVHFTVEQWTQFIDAVACDSIVRADNPVRVGGVEVTVADDGWRLLELATGLTISYTPGEVRAFRLGVLDGEFDPSPAIELGAAA